MHIHWHNKPGMMALKRIGGGVFTHRSWFCRCGHKVWKVCNRPKTKEEVKLLGWVPKGE